MMNYKGPHLSFIKPGETKLMLKLYQTISVVSEDEESCQNYPNNDYTSYEDCDSDYARKIFGNFGFIPFWLAKSPDEHKIIRPPRSTQFKKY